MKYKIVSALSNNYTKPMIELASKVNESIEEGWKPIGGVSVIYTPDEPNIYKAAQTLIKE
ncbi:MAG: DUF1737 domain-containing protein [Anaerolineaceae bacterium]|nr:DUF1737 domain-containing protein [Anaerolineaceae bacterium]